MYIRKDTIKIIFLAFLIISLGFDRISVRLGEITLRFSYLLFLATFVWLYFSKHIKIDALQTLLLLIFTLFVIPSWLISYNPLKSLAYTGWLWINYILIFLTFAFFAQNYNLLLYRSILYAFRFQIIAGWIIVLLGINLNETIFVGRATTDWFNEGRSYLFYYEPSFFAIALSSYVAIVIHKMTHLHLKFYYLDLAVLAVALYSTKSATLIFAIVIALIVTVFVPKIQLNRILISLLAGLVITVIAYGYVVIQKDLIADTLRAVITSDDPLQYLMIRSGGRVVRMTCAWDVFLKNPFFGIGIGAYEAYSRNVDLTYCLKELNYPVWGDVITNQPAISIYVELLATTGVFAAVIFFLFLLRILFIKRLSLLNSIQFQYWLGLVTMLTIMATQSNYLTLCIWMAMGVCFGSIKQKQQLYQVQDSDTFTSNHTYPVPSYS